MNFFEKQDEATRNSKKLVILFVLAVIAIVAAVYFPVQWFAFEYIWKYKLQEGFTKDNPIIWSYSLFWKVSLTTLTVIVLGSWFKIHELAKGGPVVAHLMGGRLIQPDTTDTKERQLLNVVEEMSIAAGIPVPNVYLLDREFTINAFAAGYTTGDAVIGVTRGTIDKLNRDELQGVIAHEFSHILHGDMRLNIKLMGLLHGILVISLIGRMLMSSSNRRSYGRNKGNGPLIAGGVALFVIGWIGHLFGRLIQAAVSRQREFLADASAVQYTRNPEGIGNALKIIAGYGKVPATGSHLLSHRRDEISHMTFGSVNFAHIFGWLSSHPPIEDRITSIDKNFDPSKYEKKAALPYAVTQSTESKVEPQRKIRFGDIDLPTSEKLTYGHASLLGAAGTVPLQTLAKESQWLASMDTVVEQACHNTQKAKAVMYILVGEYNEASRQLFKKFFEIRFPDVVNDFENLWEPVKNMGPENRIKLIDLCIPALRKLKPEEYKLFIRTLLELIDLDKNVTLFEFLLAKIIQRHLEHFFHPTKTTKVSIYDMYSVEKEITFLLCLLASQGPEDKVQHALDTGLKNILPKCSHTFDGSAQNYKEIDATLKTLRKTTFGIRKEILQACAKTVMSDSQASWKEIELLRAIGDTLDCPLPALSMN